MGGEEIDGGYKYAGERTEFVNVGVASQNTARENRRYMVQSTQNGYVGFVKNFIFIPIKCQYFFDTLQSRVC